MSTLVVCDASPLIFLSKIKRLDFIREVAGDEVVVVQRVCDEVLSERGGVGEVERLAEFFQTVRVENFVTDRFVGNQLSLTDRSSLAWALENEADRLLADEVLLRRIARAEGPDEAAFTLDGLAAKSRFDFTVVIGVEEDMVGTSPGIEEVGAFPGQFEAVFSVPGPPTIQEGEKFWILVLGAWKAEQGRDERGAIFSCRDDLSISARVLLSG